jgi:hypothetical protein
VCSEINTTGVSNVMDSPRSLIIAKIAAGRLPEGAHESASFRYGAGMTCSGCDEPVLASNLEVGVGFAQGAALRFHLDCFGIWRVTSRHVLAAAVASARHGRAPGTPVGAVGPRETGA